MSPQARRVVNRLPRHRREGDILAAATAVFREQGYEQASMAEIAARAGVVEGTIYKYFESKRDLLMQVMAGWYESMLANYAQHLAGIKGTGDRLRYVIWRHLSFIAGNPGLCRVFFREIRSGVEYPNSHLHDLNRRYTSYITDILRDGMASGEFRADLWHDRAPCLEVCLRPWRDRPGRHRRRSHPHHHLRHCHAGRTGGRARDRASPRECRGSP
jgi:AcrR family transcriptional regulator